MNKQPCHRNRDIKERRFAKREAKNSRDSSSDFMELRSRSIYLRKCFSSEKENNESNLTNIQLSYLTPVLVLEPKALPA